MNVKILNAALVSSLLVLQSSFAQGTAFTYQGRLASGLSAANGNYDFRFILYDNSVGGAQQGPILTNAATSVSNGLFTVTLDFGNQFPGAARWLEIGVRTNGAGSFFTLTPRQALTPTPYAIMAANATTLGGQSATNYVSKAGDTMAGALNLPPNGLAVGANQLVTTGGKLGVGTTNPITSLHVSGSDSRLRLESTAAVSYTETMYVTDARQWNTGVGSSGACCSVDGSFYIYDATASQFRFVVNTNGNVGIGTANPTVPLQVVAPGTSQHSTTYSAAVKAEGTTGVYGYSPEPSFGVVGECAGPRGIGVFGYEGADSGVGVSGQANGTSSTGVMGVGSTGVDGSGANYGGHFSSSGVAVRAEGNICYTGNIFACSDARYKDHVRTLSSALETVLNLRGVRFRWKTNEFPNEHFSERPQVGFIAQEVKEVVPEVVTQNPDGYYAVDYGRLTPLLVEAIKEQQQQIKAQETTKQATHLARNHARHPV